MICTYVINQMNFFSQGQQLSWSILDRYIYICMCKYVQYNQRQLILLDLGTGGGGENPQYVIFLIGLIADQIYIGCTMARKEKKKKKRKKLSAICMYIYMVPKAPGNGLNEKLDSMALRILSNQETISMRN